jgi:ribosome-binding protein aMBF1 (putative translation factor)
VAVGDSWNVVQVLTLFEAPPQRSGFRDLSLLTQKYLANGARAVEIARARQRLGQALVGPKETLASLRLARGLSQAELAATIGTMQPNISRMEAGCEDVRLSTMRKLSAALAVDLDRLANAIANSADVAE